MIQRAISIAVVVVGITAASSAQPPDPYAAGQQALRASEYDRAMSRYIDHALRVSFAVACNVIPGGEGNLILGFELRGVEATYGAASAADRAKYNPLIVAAFKRGADQAKQSGGCDFWMKHPEQVAEIRQEAQLALMP